MLRVGIFVAVILSALSSFGGARRFTFLYEANTSAPGSLELENWVTWRHATGPGRFDQVDFRHELEYGVTDKFQASIYLADWFYKSDPEHSGTTYSDTAIELIYNLTNPVVDPVGLSIYGELRAGDRLIELESKLISRKTSDRSSSLITPHLNRYGKEVISPSAKANSSRRLVQAMKSRHAFPRE